MIEWTEQALWQLDHAHDYIAFANSKEVAARITTQIVTTIQQLAAFPMARQIRTGCRYPRAGDFEYTLYSSLRHRS
jgi:plasmid stabilization system protein ParE